MPLPPPIPDRVKTYLPKMMATLAAVAGISSGRFRVIAPISVASPYFRYPKNPEKFPNKRFLLFYSTI